MLRQQQKQIQQQRNCRPTHHPLPSNRVANPYCRHRNFFILRIWLRYHCSKHRPISSRHDLGHLQRCWFRLVMLLVSPASRIHHQLRKPTTQKSRKWHPCIPPSINLDQQPKVALTTNNITMARPTRTNCHHCHRRICHRRICQGNPSRSQLCLHSNSHPRQLDLSQN